MGGILATMEPPRVSTRPITPAEFWRWANDQFGLWRLCAKTACRRAPSSRRQPRACLTRHLPQVPQELRTRVLAELRAPRASACAVAPE